MLARENYTAEHITGLRTRTGADPSILERTVFAFGLLEAIRSVGIMTTLVDKCAAASFSDDQRQVIVKAMKDYNDRLIDRNNELISKSGYVKNDDKSAGQYWGLKQTIPEAAKDEMEKLFGRRPASASAVTSVATNQELIERLQQKVKETDLTEKAGLDEFKAFYQSVMKPAYDAQYPDEMQSDSRAALDLDLNGSEGMLKLVGFAKQWMDAAKVQTSADLSGRP